MDMSMLEGHVETGVTGHQARKDQELGERPGHPSLASSEEAWLSGHLHLRLLASRTVRQYMSVIEATRRWYFVMTVLGNQVSW